MDFLHYQSALSKSETYAQFRASVPLKQLVVENENKVTRAIQHSSEYCTKTINNLFSGMEDIRLRPEISDLPHSFLASCIGYRRLLLRTMRGPVE